jgi:hypothetical protein
VAKFLFITWTMTCILWFIICTVQDSHDRLEDCLVAQGTTIDAYQLKGCLK